MPNTLAHIGIQGLATRRIIKGADYKWILIGCIVPDIPWIIRRVVGGVYEVNAYDLRLYAIVQSSLFFCLILSLLLATFSTTFWRTFAILGFNALFHLILDALQTKWGNGVHLMVPFSWELTSFDLFWPENGVTYLLTAFGFVYFWIRWPGSLHTNPSLLVRPLPLLPLLVIYIGLPVLMMSGPEDADNHFVKTLRAFDNRKGRYIELDRAEYEVKKGKGILTTFTGEKIALEALERDEPTSISIKGTFTANDRIKVFHRHAHSGKRRDLASYIGLVMVLFYWSGPLVIKTLSRPKISSAEKGR
jgi:hypothetical protein